MYNKAEKTVNNWFLNVVRKGSINFDKSMEEEVFDGLRMESAELINTEPKNITIWTSATELLCSVT